MIVEQNEKYPQGGSSEEAHLKKKKKRNLFDDMKSSRVVGYVNGAI